MLLLLFFSTSYFFIVGVVPKTDPVIACKVTPGSYVPESSGVDCYCAASDLGQLRGRLLVYRGNNLLRDGDYGNTNVTFTVLIVTRNDRTVRCELDWITDSAQDRKADYKTFTVAYGPGTVSIIADTAVYERHPTNPSYLTLTCRASDVFPANVTYTWTGPCQGSASTCIFKPNDKDNGRNVICTVNNYFASITKSAYFNLTVYYPPSSPPNITGEKMYDNERRNVTCSVSEGNPSVTSVTFGCGSKRETFVGTSMTISITPNASLDGQNCSCSAVWKNKNTDWYPMTAHVNITVYYTGTLREFVVNEQADNVTVNETEAVRMTCTADGRPSPALTILTDSRRVAYRPNGEVDRVPSVVSVQHDIPQAQCQHSGIYTCQIGNGTIITRSLIVRSSEGTCSTSSINVPAVIGGVIAGVVAVMAVIAVFAFWYTRNKSGYAKKTKSESDGIQLSNGNSTQSMPANGCSVLNEEGHSGALVAYDGLDLKNIGKLSEYAVLSPYQNTGLLKERHSGAAIAAYDGLDIKGIGKLPEYAVLYPYQNTGLWKGEPATLETEYSNADPENYQNCTTYKFFPSSLH